MTLLVTGGAGFIGTNFVRDWLLQSAEPVVVLDLLTYASNSDHPGTSLPGVQLIQGDIRDRALVDRLLHEHQPRALVNFAAETHVDRSIHDPEPFVQTNVLGTYVLLEAARRHWLQLPGDTRSAFRFLHVSTDEVYGSLGPQEAASTESQAYDPNSPYSATKAASNHLVHAWYQTYGLPVLTTNCSNNYGPLQFPEKLIPLVVANALAGRALPIYGDGKQIRDWLYVGDHCDALRKVLETAPIGESYNIGGWNEQTNLQVVSAICALLDELRPSSDGPYDRLITHVPDRPGHDRRCAIDSSKIEHDLGWRPSDSFESGIRKTVRWYLDNESWLTGKQSETYRGWINLNYSGRGKR